MTNLNSPCYKCENRKINCHSDCAKYEAYKDELSRLNDSKINALNRDKDYLAYLRRKAINYKKTDSYKSIRKGK